MLVRVAGSRVSSDLECSRGIRWTGDRGCAVGRGGRIDSDARTGERHRNISRRRRPGGDGIHRLRRWGLRLHVRSRRPLLDLWPSAGRSSGDQCIARRTRPLAQAAEDLAYLRNEAQRPSALGVLQGTVWRFDGVDDGTVRSRRPAQGLRVTAESTLDRHEAITGADGRYRINAVPAVYTLTFETPDGFWTDNVARALRDARGCVVADAFLRPDGGVSGRVVNSRAEPVSGLVVQAIPSTADDGAMLPSASSQATTEMDGTFENRPAATRRVPDCDPRRRRRPALGDAAVSSRERHTDHGDQSGTRHQ